MSALYQPPVAPYLQLAQGDRYGPLNCMAYAAAAVISFDTKGAKHPTGAQIRALTNEPIPNRDDPGLNLAQVDAAAARLGVRLDVRYRIPWAEYMLLTAHGHASILSVGYAPIADSPYKGSTVFRGNHSIAVFPGRNVIDPLADGRYAGLFKGPGVYPESLLRRAAAALVLRRDSKGHVLERVGDGYAYVALTEHAWLSTGVKVTYRYGGKAKGRGPNVVVAPANVRTRPVVLASTRRRTARKGEPFYVRQTTYTGSKVAGSRVWVGDASGTRWIHSSLVRPKR